MTIRSAGMLSLVGTLALAACDDGSAGSGDADADAGHADAGDVTFDAAPEADSGPRADAGPQADAPAAEVLRGDFRVLEVVDGHDEGGGGPVIERAYGRVDGHIYAGALPRWQKLTLAEGACELWVYEPAFCEEFCSGVCVDTNVCQEYPLPQSAGTLQATGLRTFLTFLYDHYIGYYPSGAVPAELFADDAVVRVHASGDVVPEFELSASGVEKLVATITDHVITLVPHQVHTLAWTPGTDPLARVHVTLNANNQSHGMPYEAIIECDAADQDGQVVIAAALVDGFPPTTNWYACVGSDCPRSTIQRYRRGFASVGEGVVRLLVASEVDFGVEHHP